MVHRLGLHDSTAGDPGSIPHQVTEISQLPGMAKKKKKKEKKEKEKWGNPAEAMTPDTLRDNKFVLF